MATHQTILSPETPKPRIPVSKAAIAVLLGVVVFGALLTTLLPSSNSQKPQDATPTGEPIAVASISSIADEEKQAKKEALKPNPSTKPSLFVMPDGIKRPDNSAALVDNAKRARDVTGGSNSSSTEAIEKEMQVRSSKSLVLDDDGESSLATLTNGINTSSQKPASIKSLGDNTRTEQRVVALENLAKRALADGQIAGQKQPWIKEYSTDTQASSRRVLKPYETNTSLVLHQGKVIPAVLGRSINSDLPGKITASTTVDIYDSLGKATLLIPKGSQLVGSYDSDVKVGQERLLFAFERLIMPNGRSFDLPAANGSDLQGDAGIAGDVDNHFFKMFATSLFIAVLADTTKTSGNTNIGTTGIIDAAGQVLADTSKTILERNRIIQPTITVEKGTRINVEVVADMVFPSAYNTN